MSDFDPGYQLNQGANFEQGLVNNYYHNAAQAALTQMYGPIAGNPQAALGMQSYQYNNSLQPLLLANQGIQNRQAQTDLDYNIQNNPFRLQQNQSLAKEEGVRAGIAAGTEGTTIASQNASNTAVAGNVGTQTAAKTTSDVSAATGDQIAAQSALALQHAGAVSAFVSAAESARAQGLDPESAFRAGVNAANVSGADPKDVAQTAAQWHDRYVNDPAGTATTLLSQNAAVAGASLARLPPDKRAAYNQTMIGIANTQADVVQKRQDLLEKQRAVEDGILSNYGEQGATIAGLHSAQAAIDQMSQLVNTMDPNSLTRKVTDLIPGSNPAQIKAYARQLADALSVDQLKQANAIAKGTISTRTQNEFEAAGHTFANFDPDNMTGAQLKQQLQLARNTLNATALATENQFRKDHADYGNAVDARRKLESDYYSAVGIPNAPAPGVSPADAERPVSAASPPAAAPPPATPAAPAAPPPAVTPNNGPSMPPGYSPISYPKSSQPTQGNDFYSTAMQHESGGRNIPNASDGRAFGYYQFEPGTWQAVRAANPNLNLPADIRQANFQQQDAAYHAFAEGNAKALQSAGIPPTDKNVFMASFLGSGGATRFMLAMARNPDAPASMLFPKEAAANPTIFNGKTLGQVYAGMTSRFGDGITVFNPTGQAPTTQTAAAPVSAAPQQIAQIQPAGTQPASPPQKRGEAPSQEAAPRGQAPPPQQLASAAPQLPGGDPRFAAMQAENAFKGQVAKVMSGRALLAKYLGNQQRTA